MLVLFVLQSELNQFHSDRVADYLGLPLDFSTSAFLFKGLHLQLYVRINAIPTLFRKKKSQYFFCFCDKSEQHLTLTNFFLLLPLYRKSSDPRFRLSHKQRVEKLKIQRKRGQTIKHRTY